jgi:hypothetical protein
MQIQGRELTVGYQQIVEFSFLCMLRGSRALHRGMYVTT